MREKLIEEYIKYSNYYNDRLYTHSEEIEENKKILDKIDKIKENIEKENKFISIYEDIIKKDIGLGGNVGIIIRKYEPELGKRLYKLWYEMDKEKNFVGEFVLDIWKEDQKRIEKRYKEKIERYEKWKKENPEEHRKIIEEFNEILDNLEEKLKNKEKAL